MSWAWPFWKEPPESPLPSSWRSTTRHFTASWTWGERTERSPAALDCILAGGLEGKGEQHRGASLRGQPLCGAPPPFPLGDSLCALHGCENSKVGEPRTPCERAAALPAGCVRTEPRQASEGTRVRTILASGGPRPRSPGDPPPERPQGLVGGQHVCGAHPSTEVSHVMATDSSGRGDGGSTPGATQAPSTKLIRGGRTELVHVSKEQRLAPSPHCLLWALGAAVSGARPQGADASRPRRAKGITEGTGVVKAWRASWRRHPE